jgi:hypothetical protein
MRPRLAHAPSADGVCSGTASKMERATRVELAFSVWKTDVLPLDDARISWQGHSDLN